MNELIRAIDTDKNGCISYVEFLDTMSATDKPMGSGFINEGRDRSVIRQQERVKMVCPDIPPRIGAADIRHPQHYASKAAAHSDDRADVNADSNHARVNSLVSAKGDSNAVGGGGNPETGGRKTGRGGGVGEQDKEYADVDYDGNVASESHEMDGVLGSTTHFAARSNARFPFPHIIVHDADEAGRGGGMVIRASSQHTRTSTQGMLTLKRRSSATHTRGSVAPGKAYHRQQVERTLGSLPSSPIATASEQRQLDAEQRRVNGQCGSGSPELDDQSLSGGDFCESVDDETPRRQHHQEHEPFDASAHLGTGAWSQPYYQPGYDRILPGRSLYVDEDRYEVNRRQKRAEQRLAREQRVQVAYADDELKGKKQSWERLRGKAILRLAECERGAAREIMPVPTLYRNKSYGMNTSHPHSPYRRTSLW
jgi:hypothetical protein